ncbi:MAG: hypothetical protein M1368_12550 [Thaumarchaeota archaeon]|nr:hypothetical protein [Nitrososphaerota archaeon]
MKELDESYVYFSRGEVKEMVQRVQAGFKNEGLEDLSGHIGVDTKGTVATRTKRVSIKKKYQRFEPAFYLPVWLMMDKGGKKRRFSYEVDINASLDFSNYALSQEAVKSLHDSMSKEIQRRTGRAITLDSDSKETDREERIEVNEESEVDIDHLTRLYTDSVGNAFLARRLAENHLAMLRKKVADSDLRSNFGFIASELHKRLEEEKTRMEETTFKKYLDTGKLVLAVSNDEEYGYRIPQSDEIDPDVRGDSFQYYLFEDVDFSALNKDETSVGHMLDDQARILWWFRNKDRGSWYAIQGWQKYKIRPDFVAAKKGPADKLEIVYVIESKGEHLVGNENTEYKRKVLNLMTEFYLVEQGKEEAEIKKMMK